MLLCGIVKGSFKETAPCKKPPRTLKHRSGGGGLMVAHHRRGGEISVVVTTLEIETIIIGRPCGCNYYYCC